MNFNFFKEPLNPSVVRIRLGGTRKSGSKLCKIDRFDFEQSDDQTRKTFDPSEVPAKTKFEDIGEHGSMIHGVIS
jgi:hypothetical protein